MNGVQACDFPYVPKRQITEMAMEEMHRVQKDAPFGWVLSLQRMLHSPATHRVDQSRSPWRLDEAKKRLAPHSPPPLASPR